MYDDVYGHFSDSLHERIRIEAFGEDIGQNSWITSGEFCEFIDWLEITSEDLVLDVGCGAGGPAIFLAQRARCRVIGIDLNESGIREASSSAQRKSLERIAFYEADASKPLPFQDKTFDVVFSIDSMNHFEDRLSVLREFRRIIRVGGRLLFTDAMTVTGILGKDEIATRSLLGPTFLAPPGENERLMSLAGLDVKMVRDVTANAAFLAGRRRETREKYRDELVSIEGSATFLAMQHYLATAYQLSSEGRLSRFAFLAVRSAD